MGRWPWWNTSTERGSPLVTCLPLASFSCPTLPSAVSPLRWALPGHPAPEPPDHELKAAQTVRQMNLSFFNFGCRVFGLRMRKVTETMLFKDIVIKFKKNIHDNKTELTGWIEHVRGWEDSTLGRCQHIPVQSTDAMRLQSSF